MATTKGYTVKKIGARWYCIDHHGLAHGAFFSYASADEFGAEQVGFTA